MIMNSNKEFCENEDGKDKYSQRRLQVNSVVYPPRKEVDWNRKAHSSPIKGYHRRFSDQESSLGEVGQVGYRLLLSIHDIVLNKLQS